MKNLILLLLPLVMAASCGVGIRGNGNVKTTEIEVKNFMGIEVSGGFEVEVTQSPEYKVRLIADENLHDAIIIRKAGNTLKIDTKGMISKAKQLRVEVQMPLIQHINSSGAIELTSKGTWSGEELDLDFSGAAEAKLNLDYKKVAINGSGASDLRLKGKANYVSIDGSGACEIKADELMCNEARIDVSGAGNVRLWVTKKLVADLSGAADVAYKGNPEVSVETSGASDVHAL